MIIQQYVDTVVINSERQILWLQRSNHTDFKAKKWGLPGGKLDPTDASIYQGAMRELAEETTLMVNYDDYLERPMFSFQNQDGSVTHYVIVNCSLKHLIVLDNDEHQAWEWLELEKINADTLAFPDIVDRIKIVLELNENYLTNQPLVKSNVFSVNKSQAYDLGLITTQKYLEKSTKPFLVKGLESSKLGAYIYVK